LDALQTASIRPAARAEQATGFPSVVTNIRNGNGHGTYTDSGSGIMPADVDTSIRPSAPVAGGANDRLPDSAKAEDYVAAEQPHRGFWHWLFGTPNLARAHRENDIQVGRMRKNIRDAKERRRIQA
jgi:hypothetical protein